MNRIRIYEQDLTTTGIQDLDTLDIVYVPGFASLLDSDQTGAPPYTPMLCTSIKQFEALFGTQPAIFNSDQEYPSAFNADAKPQSVMFNANDPDPSYIYAKELLYAGLPVVYERMNVYGTPASVPDGVEYDVTVQHMYDKLSEAFLQQEIGYGESSIKNSTVSVDGTTFMDFFPQPGKTVFTYLSTVIRTITGELSSDIEGYTLTINDEKFLASYANTGTYKFDYIAKNTTGVGTPTTTITEGTVTVDSEKYLASEYVAEAGSSTVFTGANNYSLFSAETSIDGDTVEIVLETFLAEYGDVSLTNIFTYDGSKWTDGTNDITLGDIGITLVGETQPQENDTITISLTSNLIWTTTVSDETVQVNLNNIGIAYTGVAVADDTITVPSVTVTTNVWIADGDTQQTPINLDNIGIILTDSGSGVLNANISYINIQSEDVQTNSWTYVNSANKIVPVSLQIIGVTLTATQAPVINDTVTVTTYVIDPALLDRGQYQIKYLTSGGYPTFEYSNKSISQLMAKLCYDRGDCVALIDHTNNPNRDLIGINSVYVQAQQSALRIASAYSSFASMFTPWGTYSLVGSYQVEQIDLPPSFAYLVTLANSILSNPNWLAIAGAARGKVMNLQSVDLNQTLTNSIADSYQSDTAISINPITNITPYGQCIWGNRTLVDNSIKGGTTAISFLNLRNLVSDVKKNLFTACQTLMFEQNTNILWVKFLSKVTPMLDKMVSGSGISGYKVIKGNPSDKALISATVILYPIYAVEQFEITVYLSDTELSVTESE